MLKRRYLKQDLIIDLDEVAINFLDPVFEVCRIKKNLNLTRDDVKDYDMRLCGIDPDLWLSPGFFRSLKPFPNAEQVLFRLSKTFGIIIATDDKGVPFVRNEKLETIGEYFPFVDDVIFGSEKHKIDGILIFDDKPKHLEEFEGLTAKMLRPYNEHVLTNCTVDNWLDFEDFCNTWLKNY